MNWIYHTDSLSYYYLTSEGSYARNTWVGNYYLKSDGRMAKSQWVDGGRYYVDRMVYGYQSQQMGIHTLQL